MEALSVVVNALVVSAVGFALWWVFRGRFEAIVARMDRFEKRMDRLETSVDALRSDLTGVALAVGARPQARGRR